MSDPSVPPPPDHNPTMSGIFRNLDRVDYYASGMHDRYGWILRRIFRKLFKPIRVDPIDVERVKALAEKGVVIYVNRTRSKLDYLIFNHKFVEHQLPLSRFTNGINLMAWLPLREMVKTLLVKLRYLVRFKRMPPPHKSGFLRDLTVTGRSSLLFLKRPDTLFDRLLRPLWDPMLTLIQAQREMDRPIYLVPSIVLWDRRPETISRSLLDFLMGPHLDPGRIRKALLFLRHRKHASMHVGEPLDVREFLGRDSGEARDDEDLARKLRLILRNYLFRELRVVLGPRRKPRARVIEKVLRKLQPDLETLALRPKQADLKKLTARAHDILEEMASDPDYRYHALWSRLLEWSLGMLYDGIEGLGPEQMEELRQALKRGPVVLIPNHRSHVDYMVLMNYLFTHDVSMPLIAAGINLAFFPMGHVFRRSSAFFLRRSFRGDALYPIVLKRYMAYMLREGYPMMFFIEGGRSRTGKLLQAKLGMLSMIVQSFRETRSFDDVTLLPISISYDRVVEEVGLVRELSGAPKQPENLFQLLSIHKLLQRRYGRIALRMGRQISLAEYLGRYDLEGKDTRAPAFRQMMGDLGAEIVHRVSEALTVHPSHLIATVALSRREGILAVGELLRGVERLLEYLRFVGAPLIRSLDAVEQAVADGLSLFRTGNLIRHEQEPDAWGHLDEWGGVLTIDPQRRQLLDYYRNSILGHLAPLAMLSAALLANREQGEWTGVQRDYAFLWELLGLELVRGPGGSWHAEFEQAAAFLERKRFLVREATGFSLPTRAIRSLTFYQRLIAPHLESYRMALRFLSLLERRTWRPGDQVAGLIQFARMEARRGRVRWPESISTVTYRNALTYFKANADRGFEYFRRRISSLAEDVRRDSEVFV